jgi:glutamate dehydrogenase (NADP+)
VAQYATEKVNEYGGKVVTLSDSSGYIVDEEGISPDKLAYVFELKNERRGRIKEYVSEYPGARYFEGTGVWSVPADVALPCATQNEVNGEEAELLLKNGCICVAEGANMPSTPEAIEKYQAAKILYGPGKAANAGGVAVSGLEMSQNSMRLSWTREEVDQRLHDIMVNIHNACVTTAAEYGEAGDYVLGANIAGFIKVADSMMDQGVV